MLEQTDIPLKRTTGKEGARASESRKGATGSAHFNELTQAPASDRLSPKELGRRGEAAAVRFLKRRGLDILETNWSCFAGEADIIALDEGDLCFIEVKTRSQVEKGFPAEAVDARKRERYERIAACYLQTYGDAEARVRFDVISILVLSNHHAFLRYHVNAFGAG